MSPEAAAMSPEAAAILAGGTVLALLAALIVWNIRRCPEGGQVWLLYMIARTYAAAAFRLRISQDCPLPAEGGGLVIANHRSPVDPLFLFASATHKRDGYGIRVIEFMTAREYTEVGGPVGWICRVMRCIPVNRSGQDMGPAKEALRRLQAGRLVGVFPEGRINTGEGLLPGNPGVAWLALRSGAPVYPVFIHNAPQGRNMIEPFYRFRRVSVTYGEPVDLSEYAGRKPTPQLLQEVTRRLMQALAATGGITVAPEELAPEPDAKSLRVIAG